VLQRSSRIRQPRAEATRARLVETAALAFAAHGFEAVSLNDLVAASGLSKGAFYFHFASKEELALAAFRAKQEQLVGRLMDEDTPRSVPDRLAALLRRRAELLQEEPSLGCVTRLGSELNTRSGPGSTYAGFQDLALALIADLLRDGQARKEIRSDLDPRATARAIFAAIVGIDTLSLLSSAGGDLGERSEELINLIVPGLRARPDAERVHRQGREKDHGARRRTSTAR
jgi:AcrR family transcriptional regulator